MERPSLPLHHHPARDRGPTQCVESVSAVNYVYPQNGEADLSPQYEHHGSNGVMHHAEPSAVADHNVTTFTSSFPASPSAATTRVNSGLTDTETTMTAANNLRPSLKPRTDVDTDSSGTVENNVSHPQANSNSDTGHVDPLNIRVKQIHSLLFIFISKTIFMGLFFPFIVIVLINKRVETPGGVFWAASTTNYVVSVLSQISAMLTDSLIRDSFAALRPALAARVRRQVGDHPESRPGTSFATWVGLSPAAGWSSVFQVAAVGGFLNGWCNSRLLLPLLGLAIGSILKFEADFEYYFRPGPANVTMQVYAGLTPPDIGLLHSINASDLAMYENTWSSSMLGVSQFAQDFRLPDCDPKGPCRAVILPGSLQNIRLVRPWLNESLYSVNTFGTSDTITISGSTGMVVKYEVPEAGSHSLDFNVTEECVYSGQAIDNGVQLCVKQDGQSIIVGWSACPIDIYDRGMCNGDNATWRFEPINSGTRMSLFSQVTTTSYDRKNQSIVNIETEEQDGPIQIPLSAEEYSLIFARALQPTADSSPMDTNNINALGYTVAWMHRTFLKSFRTDKTSAVTHLHNFLAVPVQFSHTARVYANYTAPDRGLGEFSAWSLPDDMIVVARGGKSASRLAILPWAGWALITVDATLHLCVFGAIGFVLCQPRAAGNREMGVQDLDDVRAARDTAVVRLASDGAGYGMKGFPSRVGSRVAGGLAALVPQRWRQKWVAGRDRDMEKIFGVGGGFAPDQREKEVAEQGRSLLEVALDPAVSGEVPAWRLARAARNKKVRIVMG